MTAIARYKLPIILAIAILTRLTVLFAFPSVFAFSAPGAPIHGSTAYDKYARNLLDTGVYGQQAGQPDSLLPPLYSALLAGIYTTFGRSYIAVGLAHILLDALSILLLYDIARRLFAHSALAPRREWIAALASLFFALYPYLIFQNLTLNDTPLWILLLHLFLWLMTLLRAQQTSDRHTFALAIAAGLVLGLSALARPLLPPLAILMIFWFRFRLSWTQTLLRLLPVALLSVIALLPWLIRGAHIHGGFVAIALNSGGNFYQGNNPQTIPIFRAGYDAQWSSRPEDLPPTDDHYRDNQRLMEAGLRYLRDNPQKIPELLWVKFQVYWNAQVTPLNNLRENERLHVNDSGQVEIRADRPHTGHSPAIAAYQDDSLFNLIGRTLHTLYFGGLWLLAISGAWLTRHDWRDMSLLICAQISQTALYLLFHPSTRYRSPTDPLLFVFSAAAIVWLANRLHQSNLNNPP